MAKKYDFIEISGSEIESSELESYEEDVVEISSSTSCDDDDDEEEDSDGDDSSDCDYDGDDGNKDLDHDDSEDDRNGWKGSGNREEGYIHVDINDEESVCEKIIQIMRGKCSLKGLKLVECRVFLRKHGLRLSGTKEECVERIKEFWRLKDGIGEAFYPRSSFTVNCTGDVCKGDVVLFSQKVYQTFGKMKRHGSVMGRRTVAGRIVKESYGAARQQHTFTVEVLWSRGHKKLSPLFSLLVKGRNLYKLKTFRQRWKNEKERLEVLDEKHQRGAAAGAVRATRKSKTMMRTDKSTSSRGAKRRKNFHQLDSSETKETIHRNGNALALNKKRSPRQNCIPVWASSSKQTGDLRSPASRWNHQNRIQDNQVREPRYLPYNYPSQTHYLYQSDVHGRGLLHFPSSRPYFPDHVLEPVPECREFNRGRCIYPPAYTHYIHAKGSRDINHFSRPQDYHSFHPPCSDTNRWR